nr:helix-turn-helix domain-containing protein [Streptomyces verrucosisporus]
MTVGELAQRCGLKASTASEHLTLLRRGGLVISRKEGRRAFHRADGVGTARHLEMPRDCLAHCCPPDCVG